MGWGKYSESDRTVRAMASGFYTKSRDEIFEQSKTRRIHAQMDPKGVKIREACDSAEHPNTTPILFFLDETGSMRQIPHEMVKDGLPTLIGTLIQNGVEDVALLFGGIGDHECDDAPLQVCQFESGDKEMDMWLTRIYLEGNGGGNAGESYLLAWYFAAHHTRTDAFEKRGKKGFLFTVGDEPTLPELPATAVKEIMGDTAVAQGTFSAKQLLEKAQEMYHVYHIHVEHGGHRYGVADGWKRLLGQNAIVVEDYTTIPKVIADIVLSYQGGASTNVSSVDINTPVTPEPTLIL